MADEVLDEGVAELPVAPVDDDFEDIEDDHGAVARGGIAKNALRASQKKKGELSYYFAHNRDLVDPGKTFTPKLIKSEVSVTSKATAHTIKDYGWLDDGSKVKIYLKTDMQGVEAVSDDDIYLKCDEPGSLDLKVTNFKGKDYVFHADLKKPVASGKVLKRKDKLIIVLKKVEKAKDVKWYDLVRKPGEPFEEEEYDDDDDDDEDAEKEDETSDAPMSGKRTVPEKYTIYNDDKAIGQPVPNLSTLKMLQGEPIEPRKPTVIVFWGKYAKGDYNLVCHFSKLSKAFPQLQVLGISCDTEESEAMKLLKKSGNPMLEQNIEAFDCDFPQAFDPDKKVGNAFLAITSASCIVPGMAYLINSYGIIVWREVFTSSYYLHEGQFIEQCKLLLAAKPLLDNGKTPEGADDEEEDDAGGGQAPDFSVFDENENGGY